MVTLISLHYIASCYLGHINRRRGKEVTLKKKKTNAFGIIFKSFSPVRDNITFLEQLIWAKDSSRCLLISSSQQSWEGLQSYMCWEGHMLLLFRPMRKPEAQRVGMEAPVSQGGNTSNCILDAVGSHFSGGVNPTS